MMDLFIDRSEISFSKTERDILSDTLTELPDRDLLALAQGISPDTYDIQQLMSVSAEVWRSMVAAYAQAILTDRARSSSRWWDLFLLVVGAGIGVAGTLTVQHITRMNASGAHA